MLSTGREVNPKPASATFKTQNKWILGDIPPHRVHLGITHWKQTFNHDINMMKQTCPTRCFLVTSNICEMIKIVL